MSPRGRHAAAIALALLPVPLPAPHPTPGRPSLHPRTASADDRPVVERIARFRAAQQAGGFAERLAAFDALVERVDPRTVTALTWAAARIEAERAAAAERLAKDDAADARAAKALERARRAYEKQGWSAATYEAWQTDRARAEDQRRALAESIALGRTTVTRLERLLDRAWAALETTLLRVADEAFPEALALARVGGTKAGGASREARRRLVDVLAWNRRAGVEETLLSIADDEGEDVRVRSPALAARAARHDAGVVEEAAGWLAAPSWVLRAAAIDALRVLHEPGGIEPLIGFLGGRDLGRLREDARHALCSLTGESHGPYAEPWAAWWREARKDFEPPRRPASVAPAGGADATASFYGISTFSTRVLFVLDVSASMAGPDGSSRVGATRIVTARREFAAALDTLEDGGTFGVLLFGGGVEASPGGLARTDAEARRRAKTFVAGAEPDGPTNMFAALEEAFALAGAGRGSTVSGLDTVFFLTDGRPTAGPVTDPDVLLASVARLRRDVPLVVHTIGIGDHDSDLLARLAKTTGGRYVAR